MVNKLASNFDYSRIEKILFALDADHSSSKLSLLKSELNKLFIKAKCKEILYTVNNDNLFFGMRVYPNINGGDAMDILRDEDVYISEYYLEFDSKLFDPMLALDQRELTAILLHEIGHIVYDTGSIDEVKKHIDMYFVGSDEEAVINTKDLNYQEVLAYAIKDSVVKYASLFTKFGNEEMIADVFVASCGYGPELESGFRKILRSSSYMNKDVDDRFIVLSWALRLNRDLKLKRLPAIKTLNKAKTLTGSQLEKRELSYAASRLARVDEPVSENAFENMKNRFSKKFTDFKTKGIKIIKNDIYELNLRLRCAEDEMDLLYIIRTTNSDISILQDYITEPDITEEERQSCIAALEELYSIRQKAAKEKGVRDKYSSLIQVVYPNLD